jgi:hypothetical protein
MTGGATSLCGAASRTIIWTPKINADGIGKLLDIPQKPRIIHSMKIEVNKYYRTRDNSKLQVVATNGEGQYPVVSLMHLPNGSVRVIFLSCEGRFYAGRRNDDVLDIIEEWVDRPEYPWDALPPEANYAAIDDDRIGFWYLREPKYYIGSWLRADGHSSWKRGVDFGMLYPHHTPKFNGVAKDSLVKRPGK